jgi:hypothetical protein
MVSHLASLASVKIALCMNSFSDWFICEEMITGQSYSDSTSSLLIENVLYLTVGK